MIGENPLHRARLDRGLELSEVARRTCLSPGVVQKIDAGRFSELPRGVYARAYVRAFAVALDLDPEEVLTAVAGDLPPAEDPLPVMRGAADRSTPAWMRTLTGWFAPTHSTAGGPGGEGASAQRADQSGRRPANAPQHAREPDPRRGSRVASIILDTGDGSPLAQRFVPSGRRMGALTVDAGLLLLLHAVLLVLTAWTCGVTIRDVLGSAGAGMAAVWAVLIVQYFVLLGGIGGCTPGAWVLGIRRRPGTATAVPLGVRAILSRAVLY